MAATVSAPWITGRDRRTHAAAFSFISRCDPADARVGAFAVAGPWPFCGDLLHFDDGFMSSHSCRTLRLKRSTRVFCCGLPGWMEIRAMLCRSDRVVSVERTTRSAGVRRIREIDLDAQAFAVDVVQRVRQPELPPIRQPIGQLIHRSDEVRGPKRKAIDPRG